MMCVIKRDIQDELSTCQGFSKEVRESLKHLITHLSSSSSLIDLGCKGFNTLKPLIHILVAYWLFILFRFFFFLILPCDKAYQRGELKLEQARRKKKRENEALAR